MAKHKFSLVACARWEEAAILEWLDYHKSIGFDHVYLWSNDDDPATLREAVAPHLCGVDPFLTFNHWPARGKQGEIYERFVAEFAIETEWFCFLDIDEFLVLKGIDNIHRFMQPLENEFGCIYFNWLNYGPNGRPRREPGSVLLGHTRRSRSLDFHTKNIIRSSLVTIAEIRAGNLAGALAYFHFWHDYKLAGLRIGDAAGEEIIDYTVDFPRAAHAFCHRPGYQERMLQVAYCAHFQFKSEEDFLRRVRRGSNSGEEHWERMFLEGRHLALLAAHDEVEDTYLADYWAPRHRMLEVVRHAQLVAKQAGEL
ncbi:glycosyltransferase family 2 protein [Lichenicoccus roseus]|uniref:Glycosyltransferase family 2 protein n=1 Tax=Lichenicoccus roseus TaxID=2683649 RepID=A0A5R9JEL6_9PROT|nr:glycosyltransferase family 2 protein [Lichenicoccus roseus]TLU73856.1 glycosyltransferase family 2 protein [Lichenicoccus roseus]